MSQVMQQAAGIGASVPVDVFPKPVREIRDPTTADKALPGQIWFNRITNVIWVNNGHDGTGYLWAAFASDVVSIAGTTNEIAATNVAGVVTLSIPDPFIAPGSIEATTTITATLGDITATDGDLVLGTAGNKINIAVGANASVGTSAAMTAGAITIAITAVTASSIIFLTTNTIAGTPGTLSAPVASIVAGVSFDIISSSATDTSTVNWLIIN